MREPGQTYNSLLEDMIDKIKKQRLAKDMKRIEAEGKFVKLDF